MEDYALCQADIHCYCLKHGYQFFLEIFPVGSKLYSTNDYWGKAIFAKKYLPFVDWLLVVDADEVIVNHSKVC